MAVKTFTTGEILTASDTNTYLANPGLDYITTGTATSGTSLSISNCFTSTWTNYVAIVNGTVGTAGSVQLRYRTGAGDDTSANYTWGRAYFRLDALSNGAVGQVGGTEATVQTVSTSIPFYIVLEMANPNVALNTFSSVAPFTEPGTLTSNSFIGFSSSRMATTTQYTGFTLFMPGTISTLTVRLYGRRQV